MKFFTTLFAAVTLLSTANASDALTTTIAAAAGKEIPYVPTVSTDPLTTTLAAAVGSELVYPGTAEITTSTYEVVSADITTLAAASTEERFDGYITLIACKSGVIQPPASLLAALSAKSTASIN
ncbi:hypothetical protein WICPIJ_006927 [Wickerhamomyces pijperi]|uniref:Uncharacterized protein n=1 Tax=Wickerhamomyces pijperi TaxID=599730 RepID=A0A9P8Q3J6_WICPI|nr:hypothetical protein WICPIJ_006927 [Wickerhamomyces pijperi]